MAAMLGKLTQVCTFWETTVHCPFPGVRQCWRQSGAKPKIRAGVRFGAGHRSGDWEQTPIWDNEDRNQAQAGNQEPGTGGKAGLRSRAMSIAAASQ